MRRTHQVSRAVVSPARVLAVLALMVALVGATTAGYAAGKARGDALIKKGSLSGNRLKPDTVTGSQVAESSLATVPRASAAQRADSAASADSLPTPPLVPFTYSSDWHAVQGDPGCRKDAAGFAHLQGIVSGTTGGAAITLPTGCRPSGYMRLAAVSASGVANISLVTNSTGGVSFGATGSVSLDGLSFYAGP